MRFRGVKVIIRDGLEVDDRLRKDMFLAWQDLQLLHATQPGLQYKYMIGGNRSWKVSSLNGVDRIELLGYEDKKKVPAIKPRFERKRKIQYVPYVYANEAFFDKGGVLACLGGLDFSGVHELISPFDTVSANPGYQYQPFGYAKVGDNYTYFNPWEYYGWWGYSYEHTENDVIVDYQINKYYDFERLVFNEETGASKPVFWDEVPWMGNYYSWDPVFYEQYSDAYDSEGNYLYDKPYQFELDYSSNEFVDTDVIIETSDPFTAFNPWYWYGSFYLRRHDDNWDRQYNVMLGSNVVYPYYNVKTEVTQYSSGGPQNVDYPRWQDYYRGFGYPDLPETENGFYYSKDQVIHSNESVRSAIDQTDPSKWAILYNHYYYECHKRTDFNGPGDGVVLVDTEVTTRKAYVKGLGHEIKLFDVKYTSGTIRLYNIQGKHICLFSAVSDDGDRVIGSLVDGGDANIIDVTNGMLVNGELKQLFSGPAITLGMLLRQEPEKVIKVN